MTMDARATQTRWLPLLLENLQSDLGHDPFWSGRVWQMLSNTAAFGVHIAIFVEPYLRYILEGKKTVESRFGASRRAPFGYVREGDALLLKRSGGPVAGICQVGQVWFYHLDSDSWGKIKDRFSGGLCAQDPAFWKNRSRASFATLMLMKEVRLLTPIEVPKRDRRPWVVLQRPDAYGVTLFP